jgi:hypothetical protein
MKKLGREGLCEMCTKRVEPLVEGPLKLLVWFSFNCFKNNVIKILGKFGVRMRVCDCRSFIERE